jgi:DNA helicase-2/ATP-dependent DNA helicase PcrA
VPPELVDWQGRVGSAPSATITAKVMAAGRSAGVGLRPIPALTVGDRVNHDTFGLGTVVALRGEADKAQAQVDFGGDYGEKWLVLRFAPLEKL